MNLTAKQSDFIQSVLIEGVFDKMSPLHSTRPTSLPMATEWRGRKRRRVPCARFGPFAAQVDPVEVAHLIFSGRQRGFDGAPPRDPKKLATRSEKVRAINGLAKLISPEVAQMMEGRDMYALRKTHISWARRLVNF